MAQARKKIPARKAKQRPRVVKRKLMNIDIREIPDVKDRIAEEAHARQYSHVEPFLRRVLVKLFRDGEIELLSI